MHQVQCKHFVHVWRGFDKFFIVKVVDSKSCKVGFKISHVLSGEGVLGSDFENLSDKQQHVCVRLADLLWIEVVGDHKLLFLNTIDNLNSFLIILIVGFKSNLN